MTTVQIGTTTVEIKDIVSFEFHSSGVSGTEPGNSGKPSLRANFGDGHCVTAHGNEAVTLKVLLGSLGIRDLRGVPEKGQAIAAAEN